MQKSRKSPEAFLASLPASIQTPMAILDAAIARALPGRTRTLWEGTFWGGTSQVLVGYGATSSSVAATHRQMHTQIVQEDEARHRKRFYGKRLETTQTVFGPSRSVPNRPAIDG